MTLRVTRPDLKNRTYGHAVEQNGRLWLQYWLWYFYNDYSLALNAGLHEGDWEMVQLRMHGDEPDVAVYAQHVNAEKRAWTGVEQETATRSSTSPAAPTPPTSRPASTPPRPGTTSPTASGVAGADARDPRRRRPRVGALARPLGRHPAPAARRAAAAEPDRAGREGAVERPDKLLDKAITPERGMPAEAPEVTIARNGDWMRITFDFERHDPPPRSLIVTVNSRDENGVPPRTYTFSLEDTGSGTLNTRIPTDPAKHYDVYTSTSAGDPPVPSESTLTLLDPVGEAKHPVLQCVAQGLGTSFAWIRGHLKRGGP